FGSILLDFSRQNATEETLRLLLALADEVKLGEKMKAMRDAQRINTTEDRAVLHIALRAPKTQTILFEGSNVVQQVHGVLDKIRQFSEEIRNGRRVGTTGKRLTDVVAIGIGGSY